MSNKILLFTHLPKCAGTYFADQLEAFYGSLHVLRHGELCDNNLKEMMQRPNLRMVEGHLHHGYHVHLPGEFQYVTILRDPISRIFSNLNHIANHDGHPLHQKFLQEGPEVFFDGTQNTMINAQVRMIANAHKLENPGDLVEIAVDHLENLYQFGFMEELNEFMGLMSYHHGFLIHSMQPSNTGKSKKVEKTQALVDLIKKHNQPELEFFAKAQEIYRRRKKALVDQLMQIPEEEGLFEVQMKAMGKPLSEVRQLPLGMPFLLGWSLDKQNHEPARIILVGFEGEEPMIATNRIASLGPMAQSRWGQARHARFQCRVPVKPEHAGKTLLLRFYNQDLSACHVLRIPIRTQATT